jgi:hypothetical protein
MLAKTAAWRSSCLHQRNRRRGGVDPEGSPIIPDYGVLALTFGTLLSSQGASAHRLEPLGPVRGNLPILSLNAELVTLGATLRVEDVAPIVPQSPTVR